MKIIILASGSKGNATYIETENTKILIDAGISYLQIKNRLAQRNISFCDLDAILVTHDHIDHIKYLASIAKKTNATIYLSEPTYHMINQKTSGSLNYLKSAIIYANYKYEIGDCIVAAMELSHDVCCCFGYAIKEKREGNVTYGYITDTGYIPNQYLPLISKLQVISIESNHDVNMLKKSGRPWPLIQRILSNQGHLSNIQCINYLKELNYQYVKQIVLSHLSEECNTEELAIREVMIAFDGEPPFELKVAKQDEPLEVIEVN
jgi:beta-lactamase domain protein